jgi:hypothetical protein
VGEIKVVIKIEKMLKNKIDEKPEIVSSSSI